MKVKSNLDEILYDKIIECLIRGDYAMGQKIQLDELAEKFEVSRTPVVQAVKLLANDGVLKVMSNGRVIVPNYEYKTVKQICDVRLLVENYALDHIMDDETVRLETVKDLEYYAKLCREKFQQKQYVELSTVDLKLHGALVKGARNEVLNDIYSRIQGRFVVVNYLVRPLKDRDFSGTVDGHDQLLDAIRAGDREQAKFLLSQHIGNICTCISPETAELLDCSEK